MANPLAVKGAVAPALKGGSPADGAKTGASRFDKVRETARGQHTETQAQLPPAVTRIPADQKRLLQTGLRQKLDQSGARTPGQFFRGDLQNARTGIRELSHRIDALPKTPELEPIRSRFTAIESQFRDSNRLLSNIQNLDNPRDLLQVQFQLYKLSQNVEIVSKVVDQVNSGTKQILQTQV